MNAYFYRTFIDFSALNMLPRNYGKIFDKIMNQFGYKVGIPGIGVISSENKNFTPPFRFDSSKSAIEEVERVEKRIKQDGVSLIRKLELGRVEVMALINLGNVVNVSQRSFDSYAGRVFRSSKLKR